MAKYRKRPPVVEAEEWLPNKTIDGVCLCDSHGRDTDGPHVHTISGATMVEPGDFIVTDELGRTLALKPKVFAALYEPDAPPDAP